jgi:hypothetical protein
MCVLVSSSFHTRTASHWKWHVVIHVDVNHMVVVAAADEMAVTADVMAVAIVDVHHPAAVEITGLLLLLFSLMRVLHLQVLTTTSNSLSSSN